MDPPTWAHNLYMPCTVNMSCQGSIDKLAIPQHSIISALWQALVNVSGVWTAELSDLGLRPQAWTHGAGVSSTMVIRPGELCARFREVRHTQTQTQLKKKHIRMDLLSFWMQFTWAAGCGSSASSWRVLLFVAKGMQLSSQQCALSMDMSRHSGLPDEWDTHL